MSRFVFRVFGAATLMLFTLLASAAAANEINFRGVAHGSYVSISGVRSGSFMAGELDWQWTGTAPAGFAQSFYSYCVDVAQNLGDPQAVTPRSSDGFTNRVVDGGAKAAWLFNTYAAGIRSNTDASIANVQAAALQVSIWEAMYDTAANLGTGNFILKTTGAIRSQAQTYLLSLHGGIGGSYLTSEGTILEVISPDRRLNQITSRVSEPSTLLLVGVAFLVFARRARRSSVS